MEYKPSPPPDSGLKYWMEHQVHQKVLADSSYSPLTADQVRAVEKFVFFTGYPRSGHSIVGSFMDAHPNMIFSYGFSLFQGLLKKPEEEGSLDALLRDKTLFFNAIYERSYWYSLVSKKKNGKGYTLDVPGSWAGKFDTRLRVIGDKSAVPTTLGYWTTTPSHFRERYECLRESVGMPLLGIHVVRNPFDMISTHTLYHALGFSWKRKGPIDKLRNDKALQKTINFYFAKAKAVQEMVPLCGMKILEIHNEDMVKDPRKEILRMCEFLEVDCPDSYLQACESKAYRNVSRTRDLVYWSAEMRAQVEANTNKYSFFRGYTFEDDYYSP